MYIIIYLKKKNNVKKNKVKAIKIQFLTTLKIFINLSKIYLEIFRITNVDFALPNLLQFFFNK